MTILQLADLNHEEFEDLDDEYDITDSWLATAQKQSAYEITRETLSAGDHIAMEDRNNFTQDFNRRVFVLFGEEHCVVFDAHGYRIHEPSDGVANGLQVLHGERGFLSDWDEGYYRLPLAEPEAAETDDEDRGNLEQAPASEQPNEAMAEELQLLSKVGQRIQEKFAQPGDAEDAEQTSAWFGGVVGDAQAFGDGSVIIGFDDGELTLQSPSDIQKLAEMGALSPCTINGGLVADNVCELKAVALSYMKCVGVFAPVGVLLDDASVSKFGGQPVYHSHVVSVTGIRAALERSRGGRPTRATQREVQEGGNYAARLGFHTFRRGEQVLYNKDEGQATAIQEIVFGVQMYSFRQQQHRNIITFDAVSKNFTVQPWDSWSCIPMEDNGQNYDLDTALHKCCSLTEITEMLSLWSSSKLVKDGTTHDKIKKCMKLGPSKARAKPCDHVKRGVSDAPSHHLTAPRPTPHAPRPTPLPPCAHMRGLQLNGHGRAVGGGPRGGRLRVLSPQPHQDKQHTHPTLLPSPLPTPCPPRSPRCDHT